MKTGSSRSIKKLAASIVSAALLITAPGLPCYQAAAAIEVKTNVGNTGTAHIGQIRIVGTPGLDFALDSTNIKSAGNLAATIEPLIATSQSRVVKAETLSLTLLPEEVLVDPAKSGINETGSQTSANQDTLFFKERKVHTAADLKSIVSEIGVAANKNASDENGASGIWASLTKFWERANPRRDGGNDIVAVTAESGLGKTGRAFRGTRSLLTQSEGSVSKTHADTVPQSNVAQPDKPRSSLSRSFKIGLVAVAIGFAVNIVVPMAAAAVFGWAPHPNYAGPKVTSTLADMVKVAAGGSVMAPVAEETIFRAGFMGGLAWLGARLSRGSILTFWLPALISSTVFVLLHETADPVFFGTRLIGSMLLSRVFFKEGLFASIAMHGFNNFLPLGLPLVFMAATLLGPVGGAIALLAIPISIILFLFLSFTSLKLDRQDRRDGRIAPYAVTPLRAAALAAILIPGIVWMHFGFLSLILWVGAAAGLLTYGLIGALRAKSRDRKAAP